MIPLTQVRVSMSFCPSLLVCDFPDILQHPLNPGRKQFYMHTEDRCHKFKLHPMAHTHPPRRGGHRTKSERGEVLNGSMRRIIIGCCSLVAGSRDVLAGRKRSLQTACG